MNMCGKTRRLWSSIRTGIDIVPSMGKSVMSKSVTTFIGGAKCGTRATTRKRSGLTNQEASKKHYVCMRACNEMLTGFEKLFHF